MKIKIPIKRLDTRGFSYDIGMVIFAVIFGIVGVAYLVASHADSCTPVSGAVSSTEGPVSNLQCSPVSSPASTPVSSQQDPGQGEQLSIPPQRRPAQYVHVCVTGNITYVTQGTPNCLTNGIFRFNYGPNVAGTVYSIPCKTTNTSSLRYAYISANETCPPGTSPVVTSTVAGEQLSMPPQRRPVQYIHVCVSGNVTYVTQGTPNCLSGGTFQFNYAPSVPGTYYSIPCATNSNTALRYAYISSSESCPRGTVLVSKN
jgi:hypothetical protein